MKNPKIMLTGGHVTVAVACIEELRKRFPHWDIVFIGRRYAFDGSAVRSEEERIIHSMGVRFLPLVTGRLTRSFSFWSVVSMLKLPVGILQSLFFVVKEKPAVILSFGGYVGFPGILAGRFLGIPVVTHEQTRTVGLVTRIAATLGSTVCVSFEDLVSRFSKNTKVVYTGLPLRSGLTQKVSRPEFLPDSDVPVLYISGGSTGSVSINNLIFSVLSDLVQNFIVVHQTGSLSLSKAQRLKASLAPAQMLHYFPVRFLDMPDYSWILQNAKLVIGRSGANSVFEFARLAKVAILIPLPWAGEGEQQANAEYFAAHAGGVVLAQQGLSGQKLLETITDVLARYNELVARSRQFAKKKLPDASGRVVDTLESFVR